MREHSKSENQNEHGRSERDIFIRMLIMMVCECECELNECMNIILEYIYMNCLLASMHGKMSERKVEA